ncbi:hypothetical protein RQP46_000647 [Phenoliferia psychrophenolica]
MFPAYSASTALSPAHYKLLLAIEHSQATDDTLQHELDRIEDSLHSATSPKAIRTALVMALYCRSCALNPVDLTFCLPAAVKLAGGGKHATLEDRRIGYRGCDEVFSVEPHSLKLLLINTIRSDLHSQSEARWAMGLRAATSPRLVTSELVPAISDRVLELFACPSAPIRRLALAALLTLSSFDSSSLLLTTRSLVLEALSPPPVPSLKKQRFPPRRAEADPRVLAALVQASRTASPIFPTAGDAAHLQNLLAVLARVVAGEWRDPKWQYHGVACGWLAAQALDAIQEVLTIEGNDRTFAGQVVSGVLDFAATILDKADLAFGLLLSSVSCFAHLPASAFESLEPAPAAVLARTLGTIKAHLESSNLNLRVLALRCLTKLPLSLWANLWGEEVWARILDFLRSRDPSLRIATLRLLLHADPTLAELHLQRVLSALASHPPPATTDHLLALLLEASAIVDSTATTWAARIRLIVSTASASATSVLSPVVMSTIDRFSNSDPDLQRNFAEKMLGDEEGWGKDLTLALVVAATAGGGSSDATACEEAARVLARWLANADEATPSEFLDSMQEPFGLALLRLLSRLPRSESSSLVLPASSPLAALFERCEADPAGFRAAGLDPRSSTLPGFADALQDHLAREALDDRSASSAFSSPQSPAPKPLRYDAYNVPTSPASPHRKRSAKGKERERERTEREEKEKEKATMGDEKRHDADAPPPADLLIELAPASLDPFHDPT